MLGCLAVKLDARFVWYSDRQIRRFGMKWHGDSKKFVSVVAIVAQVRYTCQTLFEKFYEQHKHR